MSSAVVSTPAAQGRPFVFGDEVDAEPCLFSGTKKPASTESEIAQVAQSTIKNQQSTIASAIANRKSAIENFITPASRLSIRPTPEMASTGIPALDTLTGGLPRGCLTEICGPASSGRTTILLAALTAATRRGEYCAVIDASDSLDPQSVAAGGVELDHLLWVRCEDSSPQRHRNTEKKIPQESGAPHFSPVLREVGNSAHRLEQVLRATDLLLESGGFGVIVVDLADILPQAARRIPLTTWFRFRRAVEYKPTILLVIEQLPIVGSCSSLLLQLEAQISQPKNSEQKFSERKISGDVPTHRQSHFSREAAAWESPARECRVNMKKRIESHQACPEQAQRIEGGGTVAENQVAPSHAHLLTGLEIQVELIHSRHDRKPSQSIAFATKTAWAGTGY